MKQTLGQERRTRLKTLVGVGIGVSAMMWGLLAFQGIVSPLLAALLAVPSAVGVALMLFVIDSMRFHKKLERLIAKEGIPAKALILDVRQRADSEGEEILVTLTLNVFVDKDPPFQTKLSTSLSRSQTALYQAGRMIPVRVGRFVANNGTKTIDPMVVLAPMVGNDRARSLWQTQAEFETWLVATNTKNTQLLQTGVQAPATVRAFHGLGMFVERTHPVVELEVEVTPEGAAPFAARLYAVVQANAVMKFQPGCEIWVKFDAHDTTQVALFGSTSTRNTLVVPFESPS